MVKIIRDYYKILGVSVSADKKTIKKAYKKASDKYNLNLNNSKNAEAKLKLVEDAYIVLSDDTKRYKYDQLRRKALKNKSNKKSRKNKVNLSDEIKTVKDIEDNYGIISKLFNFGSGAAKGHTLMTGTNLLVGGALAGYGVKKGRDYMNNRGRKNNN